MWEHKNTGKTQGTKNKNPKLVWFAPLTSRESAEKTELELKKTIKKNPRIITSKILAFKDLVKELDY